MESLPPRKNPTPTRVSKQSLTPLQTLVQMGFTKHRAEKSMAATGNQDVHLAADWILSHINDPLLDEAEPREYVLYLCPTGPFLRRLQEFWSVSKEQCGWNGAHNCLPHITLVSFFKAPDECEPELATTLRHIIENANGSLDRPLEIELFTNTNFMGLFVKENDANYLRRIALQYVKEVSPSIISDTYEQLDALVACFPWCGGVTSNQRCIPRSSRSISLEPHVRSLHLTLAYKFDAQHHDTLKGLISQLVADLSDAQTWELRLYSRDPRVQGRQVFRAKQQFRAREGDELELHVNDLVCAVDEHVKQTADGWLDGFSHTTGVNGQFPLSFTTRVPESATWTLHCSVPLRRSDGVERPEFPEINDQSPNSRSSSYRSKQKTGDYYLEKPTAVPDRAQSVLTQKNLQDYIKRAIVWNASLGHVIDVPTTARKLFVVRHGERMDFTFDKWVQSCMDKEGVYHRLDLNMPKTMPLRQEIDDWLEDTPLTTVGYFGATSIGDMLKDQQVPLEFAYSSPAWRCVQTLHGILEGWGKQSQVKIRIEPSLYEWCGWHTDGLPQFASTQELIDAGFNIDESYEPLVSVNDLRTKHVCETVEEFYDRNHKISDYVDRTTDKNVILMGHASNLETNTRLLLGRPKRTQREMMKWMGKISYLSLVQLEKSTESQWQFVKPNVYPLSHNKNPRFDYRDVAGSANEAVTPDSTNDRAKATD